MKKLAIYPAMQILKRHVSKLKASTNTVHQESVASDEVAKKLEHHFSKIIKLNVGGHLFA